MYMNVCVIMYANANMFVCKDSITSGYSVCGFIQRFPHNKMIEYHHVECSLQCPAKRIVILFVLSGQGWVDLEFLCYLKTAPATQQRHA